MAIKPLNLQDLQQGRFIVDKEGRPTTELLRILNGNVLNLRIVFASLVNFLDNLVELNDLITEAQSAADAANAAAEAAAEAAQASSAEQALVASWIDPASVLSASPTTITVDAHDRIYADSGNTTVPVAGGSIPHGGVAGDVYYVFYSDPTRAGGSVAYQIDTVAPAQTGSTHVVGAVTIPGAGTVSGGRGPLRPGFVEP